MAAFGPGGPPRPGNNYNSGGQSPSIPPYYNNNGQSNAGNLADNFQNMNLNRPLSMPVPNSAPRPSPFGQNPTPFPPPALQPTGVSVSSVSFSRPGPPPAAHGRPGMPPSAVQQATFPSNAPSAKPTGPLSGQPTNIVSRPPQGSSPMMGGQVPLSAPSPSSSSPSLGGMSAPLLAPSGLPSNGPPSYVRGTLSTCLGYPSAINAPQTSVGPPPTRAPYHAPYMHSLPNVPIQAPPQFSQVPQGGSPPSTSFTPPVWSTQPGQVAPPFPGSLQPPRMHGMPTPPVPNQSMASISPTIPQTGSPLSGHSKIDPNQIPRPAPNSSIILHDTRQANQGNSPPPASTEYIVRDTGNCSPRYMRCTTCQIPCTSDLLNTSGMQLALLIQPFALPHASEEAVQVVDFGESGPVRCSRCKGYINPFMKFIDQGKRFICNLCGFIDETPREYHCNLGPDGRRRDADERPELCRGTVEFVASKEYMVRDPMPAVYFFLIDVSINALQTGATAAACSAVNQVISDLPEGPRTMIGIATFDSTIHFYNLKRALQQNSDALDDNQRAAAYTGGIEDGFVGFNLKDYHLNLMFTTNWQPLMLIVPDIQDVYTPLQSDVIVQLSECRQHLQLLLESIPTMFQSNRTAESAFGAGIKAAFLAMKSTGGKLMVFQSVLPSTGIGALSVREAEGRTNVSAGEKEANKLLHPADKIFQNMATEFAEYQVCVDVFITTQNYVDIASISVIPRTTGGQVYYYYPFSALSDSGKLYNDLRWNVTRPQGFEAVMRVRCSQGIQVDGYHGNFCKRIPTDLDLPGIDSDKTIMVTLKHDDKLQDGSECAFQCALLYTTVYGQRRIRVSTLSLPCTSMLSNLFRAADLDTLFGCFLKRAAIEIPTTPLLQVHEHVTNLSINVLLSYRKYCATVSSSGQLILPEALKLLPLYTLALIKSSGLRTDGRIDDRSFWINQVSSVSAPLVVPFVYPRMIAIHELNSEKSDAASLPSPVPLTSEHVNDEGIYLLENGEDCLIYVGKSVDSSILHQIFGVSSADEIPSQFVLQQYSNPRSQKLNDLVNEIRRERRSYLRLRICKKGDPSGMLFFSYMVEDKNLFGPSYVEFLVHIHRQIQLKMSA